MIRAFEIFEQFFNLFEVRESQLHRLHDKRFPDRLRCGRQAQPQKAIYQLLERFPGLAGLSIQQLRDIFIESESGSHIMMLS
jgi:hypothetical protein